MINYFLIELIIATTTDSYQKIYIPGLTFDLKSLIIKGNKMWLQNPVRCQQLHRSFFITDGSTHWAELVKKFPLQKGFQEADPVDVPLKLHLRLTGFGQHFRYD
ncbi:hypothetical protein DYD21_03175 [Rhodohalobacter sp. SW132]|uniref:hypothetical protein n=1 Tax=Rhodohalobacter sp. SW132 TaxID=2293433 RepID=UPI000E259716|nr:hypothetical protein [Rhodohalobacter sp. SW132]REL38971.1 hypothetical protein DYD21_03175 [Rhodohalobacter sp. SW132]